MRRLLRRNWPILILVIALVGVVIFRIAVDRKPGSSVTYSKIEDGLYLGGAVTEPPPGTQAVLNLCEHKDLYEVDTYCWHPIPDAAPAPSLDWLQEQVEFVQEQRVAGKTVYVHCAAGVSRGGMVVTAYLMAHNGWSRDQALEFIRQKRAIVNPNPAFMQLLLEWEDHVRTNPQAAKKLRHWNAA
jgi:hypothetical protein